MANLAKIIQKDSFLLQQSHLLLACSGGVDSLSLAHAFWELGLSFDLAHMNYLLREEDSLKDQDNVIRWGLKHDVCVWTKMHDLRNEKGNIQKLARNARYEWMDEVRLKSKASLIITAHHQDDLTEGAFLKLLRGVPWHSAFLLPKLSLHIYRPLLEIPKSVITQYARSHNIQYREDASNANSEKYDRNFVRNELLPLICNRRADVLTKINSKFFRDEKDRSLFHWMANHITHSVLQRDQNGWTLDLDLLKALNAPDDALLLEHTLNSLSMPGKLALQILDAYTGAQWVVSSGQLSLDRGKLCFTEDQENDRGDKSAVLIKGPGRYQTSTGDIWSITPEVSEHKSHSSVYCITISTTKFPFPWTLRTWGKGDFIRPWGMLGKRKKLQDIFTDQKIPRNKKDQIWFLCADDEILWIPGLKKSELLRESGENKKDNWLVILYRKEKKQEL